MRKILLGLLALVALAIPASAQKVGVYATYGAYTSNDAIGDYHRDYKVKTSWGSLNAGIDFNFGKFKFGPSYSFSSTTTKHGDWGIYYHTILLNGKYDYYRTGPLQLYGHIGLGATITHFEDDGNEGHFAFQVSPIGAKVKLGSGFSFIGELGFGAQGVIQLGFGYDF